MVIRLFSCLCFYVSCSERGTSSATGLFLKLAENHLAPASSFVNSANENAITQCVYILFSEKDYLLYIGYTANLQQRIQTHDNGGNKSIASRRSLQLVRTGYIHLPMHKSIAYSQYHR
ncbi:MAG: hypothetical protein C4330_11450 [Chitinophagaceae bacterium]